MTDPTATVRALLALQAEVDRLRELLDAKSHEAGLYARRMEQAQRERDELRAENRKLRDVLAWSEAQCPGKCAGVCGDALTYAAERGEHRREGER